MARQYSKVIISLAAVHLIGSAVAEDHHDKYPHHNFPKDVDAFHALLAPLWHAKPGKERSLNVCAKANELESSAKNIRSGDATLLLNSIGTLKQKCQTGPADIDAAFFDVHEAFHRLAEPRRLE